jgi:hypothetical protein
MGSTGVGYCRWLVVLLALGIFSTTISIPAQAETLYRCIDAQQRASYQAQACAPGQRLSRTVDYQPDPVRVARAAPVLTARSTEFSPSHRRSAGVRYRMRSPHAQRSATSETQCRRAKAHRESRLQRLGLARTYAQLSALDADVRAACPRD